MGHNGQGLLSPSGMGLVSRWMVRLVVGSQTTINLTKFHLGNKPKPTKQ